MRSNRSYSLREQFSALRKYVITKLSLVYLNVTSARKAVIVRDGGLGDAIMATTVVEALKKKYPKTQFFLSTGFPEVFDEVKYVKHSLFSFPVIWLSYTHYDLYPWRRKATIHYSAMMAKLAGVHGNLSDKIHLNFDTKRHQEFINTHVKGKRFMVIQPHAGEWFPQKNWSISKWNDLVGILKSRGYLVYQIGTAKEQHINGTIDFRGKTSILESLILLKNASFLIGVNSFAEQAAWAFNVPAIILYGPTNPHCSLNPNQYAVFSNKVVSYSDLKGTAYEFYPMADIKVDTVLEAMALIGT
uniref:glycosyltransferase family 9 protein n=1 Tax=Roseivirga sp. TaxID=1964215 RepID=UPI00404714BC